MCKSRLRLAQGATATERYYIISAQWAEAERVEPLVQTLPFKQIHFSNT